MSSSMFSQGSAIAVATEDTDHLVAQLAKEVGAKEILNRQMLVAIISNHHRFPSEHRVVVWRYLFKLPMNKKQYTLFASQQRHPAIRALALNLPVRYQIISNRLMRLLSVLTYWHPPLGECDWLPGLVFPFLRIFERDSLISFEFVLTLIYNWCPEWLYFVPNPPVTVLARIDRIARAFGGEAPVSVAWPALRSFFGEVATTEAALMLFDNIIAARPAFLEYLVAAFALIPGEKIVTESNVVHLIERAKRMYEKDFAKHANQAEFAPLPTGHYPVMEVVEKVPHWREREVERIRLEAEASRQQETLAKEIEREAVKIERQRKIWMAERALLREIEEEQMQEFRRREQEILMRESKQEEMALQLRRERIRTRRLEEEQAIEEWRRDCEKIQTEMCEVSTTRRATWANWLTIKEDAAQLAREEVQAELDFLKQRNDVHAKEMAKHRQQMADAASSDQKIISEIIRKNRQLEEEKYELRQQLDKARAEQAASFDKNRLARIGKSKV